MARKEFSKAVKVAVIKRATVDGQVYCEECGSLTKGRFDIDHIRPDGLLGEPVIENAKLLCKPCHDEKTKADVANIAQAKRREALHLGVRKKPSFVSRGFAKFTKAPKQQLNLPPRKPMYRDKD
jgi:hypothetical protein